MTIRSFKKWGSALALALGAVTFAHPSLAQTAASFPHKPVKLLVSFPPGGFADLVGRGLAQALSQLWGQPVVVDNKPGGASILATELAAKAPPDGYTLYLATDGPFVINPFLYKTLSYDPVNDFTPAAMVAQTQFGLVVNPDKVSAKTVAELVATLRADPAKVLDYSSGGAGGPHHLHMETFKANTGTNLAHIPYKGGAPALQAVLSGEVSAAFAGVSTAMPHVKAGKLRMLAAGGAKRSLLAPDVPTFTEAGYPGFEPTAWAGVVVPKGTPQAIVDKIEADVLKVARDPQFSQKLVLVGADPLSATAAEFRQIIRTDQQKHSKLIRELNIKAE